MLSFFFSSRRRHTRSLRDWSSDVCSSDLAIAGAPPLYARADRVDAADDLVTRDDGSRVEREVAFAKLKVGTADAAGGNAKEEHPGGGRGGLPLDGAQRPRRGRRGALEQHGAAGSPHRPLILTFSPQAGR